MATKFADMAPGRVSAWVAWANSHDWGQVHDAKFDGVGVRVESWNPDYTGGVEVYVANDPSDLRAWAGY